MSAQTEGKLSPARLVAPPKVLMVAYGGGHIRMVLAVANYLRSHHLAQPIILGLNTARAEVLSAGFSCLGFADFVRGEDTQALAHGQTLAQLLSVHSVDLHESAAYLGLSYADLAHQHGQAQAEALYAQQGRQCFLPVPTLLRILQTVQPDALLVTSAPRAERAAVLAARQLGVPTLCMVDLFATHEIAWLKENDYADRVCVLNNVVQQKLVDAGRNESQIIVTGNPAFDTVNTPSCKAQGAMLRQVRGWQNKSVILWISQVEPLHHPAYPGQTGNPNFPHSVLTELRLFVAQTPGTVLVVRPHPSEAASAEGNLPNSLEANLAIQQEWLSPQTEALHPLLHACDIVVTISSTVAIEAKLAGKKVLQVLGSLYSASAPYMHYGIADTAVSLSDLKNALIQLQATPPQPQPTELSQPGKATQAVAQQLLQRLGV